MTHRYAAIDIGTNTLRLLIAGMDNNGITPIVYDRRITRLGGKYDEKTGIDPASAERTINALAEFKRQIRLNGVENVTAVATSVVRRSANKEWFLGEALKKTGVVIDVISGDEEARLSLLGVLSVLRPGGCERRMVIDIGGGSTEFILTDTASKPRAWSMEMGVVHLTEMHLKSDPPSAGEVHDLEADIEATINELKQLMLVSGVDPAAYSKAVGAQFVGTAGTITTLAALDMNLIEYDRNRINNHKLSKETIRAVYDRLLAMNMKERSGVLSLEKGREDLIIPGTAITLCVMEAFGFDEVIVSDAGLLEGVILSKGGL
ncbi:MAG: Ppx/GppA family phosphatase [Deltaproteobacteria bacterium]|nr:Ppx/GppA family phosphatase [Deltaproteobacteria bacterium]